MESEPDCEPELEPPPQPATARIASRNEREREAHASTLSPMSTGAEAATRPREKDWWRRAVTVLWMPGETFRALREDSTEAAEARQEPLTAVVFLAGISIFLSTQTAGQLFDDRQFDLVILVVEAIVAGLLVGLQNFWLVGGAVHLGARGNKGEGSYRQARHLVGFAFVPFVLSLVAVWPIRLAIFGSDLFSSGGADGGAGGNVFRVLDAGFLVWSLGLLLLGMRTLNGWSWSRSFVALALAGVFVVLFIALAVVA